MTTTLATINTLVNDRRRDTTALSVDMTQEGFRAVNGTLQTWNQEHDWPWQLEPAIFQYNEGVTRYPIPASWDFKALVAVKPYKPTTVDDTLDYVGQTKFDSDTTHPHRCAVEIKGQTQTLRVKYGGWSQQLDSMSTYNGNGAWIGAGALATVPTSSIIASYSEANENAERFVNGGIDFGEAQSFTGTAVSLTKATFFVRVISGTGTAVAKLYTHSGTYGTSSVPGSLLATSNGVDITTLASSLTLQDFTFSGGNQYTLSAGTKYVITIEVTGTGEIGVGMDTLHSPSGNWAIEAPLGTWTPHAGQSLCFYLYGGVPVSTAATDLYNSFEQPSSVSFNYAGTSGTLTNSGLSVLDLSRYVGRSNFYLNFNIQSATNLTGLTLKVGSSSGNYITISATTDYLGATPVAGWNKFAFPWSGTTAVVGTPVYTAISFVQVTITYSANPSTIQNNIENLFVSENVPMAVDYYSNNMVIDGSGNKTQIFTNAAATTDTPLWSGTWDFVNEPFVNSCLDTVFALTGEQADEQDAYHKMQEHLDPLKARLPSKRSYPSFQMSPDVNGPFGGSQPFRRRYPYY